MTPAQLARREARKAAQREWHHQNYQRIKQDPELYARMRAQKNAARQRARENAVPAMPDSVDVDIYRTYGPWAPLFILQQVAA